MSNAMQGAGSIYFVTLQGCVINETDLYIDVCSLYPFICKYGLFPLGHPTILSQENIDQDNLQQYCGLIKCKVLPPTDLYHPVLP